MEAVEVNALHEADTAIVSRLHHRLRQAAQRHGVPLVITDRGANISPDPNARIYVVHPGSDGRSSKDVNNASLCLKVVIGRTSMFFSGDAEGEAEEEMTRRYGRFLSSDVLKAGHHGSSTSSGAQFLHSITPKIALISVGEQNKFGHPSPDVLRLFQTRNTAVFRTDREGALVLESDGSEWKHIDWR
jgi:beta-lactamase superfamily II metal-dependent hydrolase